MPAPVPAAPLLLPPTVPPAPMLVLFPALPLTPLLMLLLPTMPLDWCWLWPGDGACRVILLFAIAYCPSSKEV